MIEYFMVVTGQAQISAVERFILNFNGANLKVFSHLLLLGVIIITTWCYDTIVQACPAIVPSAA